MLKSKWFIAEIISIVALLLAIWLVSFLKSYSSIDASIFEALTALFSLFAFIAVVVTFSLQYRQLQNQQEQISQQNFEATLFNMLATQRHIIDQLEYDENKGRTFFQMVRKDLINLFHKHLQVKSDELKRLVGVASFSVLCKKKKISHCFNWETKETRKFTLSFRDYINKLAPLEMAVFISEIIFHRFYFVMEHYFQHIYIILKFINDTENQINNGEYNTAIYKKYKTYAQILRAQISQAELVLLFYYALTNTNMKKLIEYYDFMSDLDKDALLDPSHLQFYNFKKES